MVRKERLELSRVTPLEPKSSASTSSATLAMNHVPRQNEPKALTGEDCHRLRRVYKTMALSGTIIGPRHLQGGQQRRETNKKNPSGEDGGPCRTRTYNQLIKSQLLYQIELTAQKRLRWNQKQHQKASLRLGWTMGLEPTTTGITIRGSTI